MITDNITNLSKYASINPAFPKAIAMIETLLHSENLNAGKIECDHDFYINIDDSTLKQPEDAFLEVHDQYIDIQIPLTHDEKIGYSPRAELKLLKEAKPENDIAFYSDMPSFIFPLHVGYFAIFFPWDAHAPLIGQGKTRKIIAKIKLQPTE